MKFAFFSSPLSFFSLDCKANILPILLARNDLGIASCLSELVGLEILINSVVGSMSFENNFTEATDFDMTKLI